MRQRMPAGPARRRSNSISNIGRPGASASNPSDAAERTDQRVSAALGTGSASTRSISTVVPDRSAASASRRLAVRSSAGHLPQHSTINADRPAHRAESAAPRSSDTGSGARARTSASGSLPSSARPGPYSFPPRRSASSVRSQRIGASPSLARSASIAANPAAPAASLPSSANSSCSLPRASPPPKAASNSACPVENRSPSRTCAALAIPATYRLIRARWSTDSRINVLVMF